VESGESYPAVVGGAILVKPPAAALPSYVVLVLPPRTSLRTLSASLQSAHLSPYPTLHTTTFHTLDTDLFALENARLT